MGILKLLFYSCLVSSVSGAADRIREPLRRVPQGLEPLSRDLAGGGDIYSEHASKQPLFEAGVGFISLHLPQYPASSEYRFFNLPVPLLLYRGGILRADADGGLRGRIMNEKNFELNFSYGGSLPADSSENKAREGMPDLDLIGEFGPQIVFHLHRSNRHGILNLHVPVRYVFSTDFKSLADRGFSFAPFLNWRKLHWPFDQMSFRLTLETYFTTAGTQKFFYQVDQEFATPTRSEFSAKGGYLGTYLIANHVIPYKKFDFYFSYGVISHHGAVSADSPLFENKFNFMTGLGITWNFHQSKARAVF